MATKLEKPEWFTKELYDRHQKEGRTKEWIRDNLLFVTPAVARRWFAEIGVEKQPKKISRPDRFTSEVYREYKEMGMTHIQMAKKLKVSHPVFSRFLREIGER